MLKTRRIATDKTGEGRKQVRIRYNTKNMLVIEKVRYEKSKSNIIRKSKRQNHNVTLKKKEIIKTIRNATDETKEAGKQMKRRYNIKNLLVITKVRHKKPKRKAKEVNKL